MTEGQGLAAEPVPWNGAGQPVEAVPDRVARPARPARPASASWPTPAAPSAPPAPVAADADRGPASVPPAAAADPAGRLPAAGPALPADPAGRSAEGAHAAQGAQEGEDRAGGPARDGRDDAQAGQARHGAQPGEPGSGGRDITAGSSIWDPPPASSAARAASAPAASAPVAHSAPEEAPGQAPGSAPAEPYIRVDARRLETALLALRHPIVTVPLLLEAPGVAEARAERRKLLSQIDDYLLPRLRQSGAPVLVALVGSTGAGKSTLLNSIAGSQVSATGIRRPTTNSPVLACHPSDAHWFAENVFLPTLPRVRQEGLAMPGRDGLLVLAASEGIPPGVALLDTPDIDSVVQAHREFAHQFLDASDLWLFATTSRRYADAAVWELLQDARDRGAALGIVLSRVPPAAAPQLTAHFDAMLEANGLTGIRRFVIPETIIRDAKLPVDVSGPVREWLEDTARQDDRRVAVLTQTMSGVLDTFRTRVPALAQHADLQLALRRELRETVGEAYAASLHELDEASRNGSLLHGEVAARWQEFAGTGDLLRTLQVRRGRGRSRKRRMPARAAALKAAIQTSLEALLAAVADRAAEDSVARWQQHPAGAALLAGLSAEPDAGSAGARYLAAALADLGLADAAGPQGAEPPPDAAALARPSPAFEAKAAQAVRAWQEHVLQLVQAENVTKRSIARVVSFDQESLALVLAIAVLGIEAAAGDDPADGPDPGASGADAELAESSSAIPQRLLTSLFGAGLLRDIGTRARLDLHERVSLLFEAEIGRFGEVLDGAGVPDESVSAQLYEASYALEGAR